MEAAGRGVMDWRLVPQSDEDLTFDGVLRCRAKSTRSGERCRRAATPGTWVCATHGSSSPAVRQKAQLRLLELVNPATAKLARILASTNDDRVALKAVEMIYDRTGLHAKVEVDDSASRQMLVERLIKLRDQKAEAARAHDDVIDADIVYDTDPETDDPDNKETP